LEPFFTVKTTKMFLISNASDILPLLAKGVVGSVTV